jgi:divalent metal cation (Fe/Co/Zn/Cd) transporter
MTSIASDAPRHTLVRRALLLNYLTLAYNALEAVASLVAGVMAGSVALVGFGVDSVIEVTASVAAQWRLRSDAEHTRARAERRALFIIGWCFIALATYVAYDAVATLWLARRPEASMLGIAVTALSVVIMPILAQRKRRIARQLGSGALSAEATQTSLCAYLSAIVLAGLALNALAGWWWADPVAALAMVPIIAREGIEGVQGRSDCDDCAHSS